MEPTLGLDGKGWPPYGIPEELFACISTYLPRRDICSLRLVNKEFAFKMQHVLFRTSVVPFTPTVYSIDQASTEKVDNFEVLGGSISRFGVSFEIDQISLFCPPTKSYNRAVTAFWGKYEWPKDDYVRYDSLRDVEDVADQVCRTRRAFETLTEITELALSFDTGYGWLNPPVLSVKEKSLVFEGRRSVFGERLFEPGIPPRQRSLTHASLKRSVASIPGSLREYLGSILTRKALVQLYGDGNNSWYWSPLEDLSCEHLEVDPTIGRGRLYGENRDRGDCQIYPRQPTRAHAEWLLETAWAAQAVLGSCICAITDIRRSSPSSFRRVHTLNISSISSGLLHNLSRSDFFEALPCLKTIILLVIPDWKQSDAAWDPQSPIKYIDPSTASVSLTRLLGNIISHLTNISCLTVGYAGGGEHAKGSYARNQHILPAPITEFAHDAAIGRLPEPPLIFPHVKKLTFYNCWFSPHLLVEFFNASYPTPLEDLKFDSCSLTASPGTLNRPLVSDAVHPDHPRSEYFRQRPRLGTWSDIINKFTPGLSISEQAASIGLGSPPIPRPDNIPPCLGRLEFVSCGYVRLAPFFNQNNLVVPNFPRDQAANNAAPGFQALAAVPGIPQFAGGGLATQLMQYLQNPANAAPAQLQHNLNLVVTQQALQGNVPNPPAAQAGQQQQVQPQLVQQNATLAALPPGPMPHEMHTPTMQAISTRPDDPSLGHSYIDCRFLGTIVQCIGADEEQILECGFGMRFGWEHDEEREAVQNDGFKRGGTGRFSGVILKSDERSSGRG
ncbi:hypothetical protein AJ79_02109 [Helicocarpus griseus UAMH5409]|uniref:F-box domain-containing protein n=1 Tax=Helicocarpus griseus UAMH5409 TaxID=1447875 RepID=A0A2B7Y504_9EURO|nr:hypothetical protein AJ79_02109 [Helicocarpus griseus UAMH5409]